MLNVSRLIKDRTILRSDLGPAHPVISVIMSTYCRGELSLRKAIDSVLTQTFTSFEFIIIDDGSRDSTFEVLKEYQAKDHRIIIIRHYFNSGLPALRINEGILEARGKYISYQFDDDEYLPNCLQTLYQEIIQYDKPCLVYGNCQLCVKNEENITQEKLLGQPFNYGLLVNGNYIANNSVLHHKVIFESTGMYDPHVVIRRFSDWDLWLRMGKKFPFYWVNTTITKAVAGEKDALGTIIEFKSNYIRKYIESFRGESLLPQNITQYEVDNLQVYPTCFNAVEIDDLNRTQIIPYRCKVPYYFTNLEIHTANITKPHRKTIAVTKSDFSTSIDVTIRNHTHRIKNFPYDYFFINESSLDTIHPSDYSLLILSRTIGPNSTRLLKENMIHNKPTAYFMDDNMFKFHELGPEFGYLQPHTTYYKNLEYQISNSNLIGSYSPIISSDCKKYNNNVIELKTNIPGCYFQKKNKPNNEPIKIAMFSGSARKNILHVIWPSLERISKKYGDSIEFHFWGLDPKEYGELKSPVYYVPFTHSYDQYINQLMNSYFDYHICPLDGNFDAFLSKSPIKFLEGTISGSVGIFSNVQPYTNIPDYMCLKAENTVEAWYETIDYAINLNNEKRFSIYEAAYDYIMSNYSTESQVNTFLSALEATELLTKLKQKKIAYFVHDSYLGGATLHLLKHALMVREYGIEIMICLPEYQRHISDLPELLQKYNLDVYYFKTESFIDIIYPRKIDLHYAKEIAAWFKENNIGLVHSVTFFPAVGIACKINRIPHVASLHKFYSNKASKAFLINNILIDIVHSSSSKYSNAWSEELHIPSRKIVCPVDAFYFKYYTDNKKQNKENQGPIKILIPGTLKRGKNQHAAIKAGAILKKKGYNIQLDLIGYHHLVKDYTNLCNSIIQSEGLQDNVKIQGFTDTPGEYYANADILLCSSIEESTPQTILKAMASGILVVSTDVGGVTELIKNNYSGIIADGIDEHSLASALEKAIRLTQTQKTEIITNAFNIINMVGHPKYVCTELLSLYNEAFDLEKIHSLPQLLE